MKNSSEYTPCNIHDNIKCKIIVEIACIYCKKILWKRKCSQFQKVIKLNLYCSNNECHSYALSIIGGSIYSESIIYKKDIVFVYKEKNRTDISRSFSNNKPIRLNYLLDLSNFQSISSIIDSLNLLC